MRGDSLSANSSGPCKENSKRMTINLTKLNVIVVSQCLIYAFWVRNFDIIPNHHIEVILGK